MVTTKPYLIRAIHEWAVDNSLTPEILVDISIDGVEVPSQYVKDGQIVLNIGPQAVQMQEMSNDWLRFSARFGGVPRQVDVPVIAVIAIYARENGQGLFFKEPEPPGPESEVDSKPSAKASRPNLKLVK